MRRAPGVQVLCALVAAATAFTPAPASAALGSVDQNIILNTPLPTSVNYLDTFTVDAVGGASQMPLVFTSSGVCTNVDNVYTMTAGVGDCTVMIDQPGNHQYVDAAQYLATVAAGKAPTFVTLMAELPDSAELGSTFEVSATAGPSTMPLEYDSEGGCTNGGTAVYRIVSLAQDCEVTVRQPAGPDYAAAEVFTIVTVTAKAATPMPIAKMLRVGHSFRIMARTKEGALAQVSVRGTCRLIRRYATVGTKRRLVSYSVRATRKGSCYVTISAQAVGDYGTLLQDSVRVPVR